MRALSLAAISLIVIAVPATSQEELSGADRTAVFRAAGFKQEGGQWRACDDPGTAGYTPGEIAEVRDLNGDGLPEAIVTEGSTFCFGLPPPADGKSSPRMWRAVGSHVLYESLFSRM